MPATARIGVLEVPDLGELTQRAAQQEGLGVLVCGVAPDVSARPRPSRRARARPPRVSADTIRRGVPRAPLGARRRPPARPRAAPESGATRSPSRRARVEECQQIDAVPVFGRGRARTAAIHGDRLLERVASAWAGLVPGIEEHLLVDAAQQAGGLGVLGVGLLAAAWRGSAGHRRRPSPSRSRSGTGHRAAVPGVLGVESAHGFCQPAISPYSRALRSSSTSRFASARSAFSQLPLSLREPFARSCPHESSSSSPAMTGPSSVAEQAAQGRAECWLPQVLGGRMAPVPSFWTTTSWIAASLLSSVVIAQHRIEPADRVEAIE